jgi:CBS domain-containing membrane protein
VDLTHWIGPKAAGREWLRGALGGLLGIGLTAWLSHGLLGSDPALPWLVAPMGASTVLLFVVPASPFSRPWPVLAGHLLSATIGHGAHVMLGGGALTIGLAVGTAIAVMSLARCLHPPAGGTAVLMALGSPAIATAGWSFIAAPIALNVMVLLALAFAFHRATGHTFPHHAAPTMANLAEIEAVLADWDEVLDISGEDLAALIEAVEHRRGR